MCVQLKGPGALRSSHEKFLCKVLLQWVLAQCKATRAMLWFVTQGLFCGYQARPMVPVLPQPENRTHVARTYFIQKV